MSQYVINKDQPPPIYDLIAVSVSILNFMKKDTFFSSALREGRHNSCLPSHVSPLPLLRGSGL